MGALLHLVKLLKGCIGAVLSQGHPVLQEIIYSCPSTITLWVLCAV